MKEKDGRKYHSAVPESQGALNVLKRALQFTELEWQVTNTTMPGFFRDPTPDRTRHDFFYEPGKTYRGIPYSSLYEKNSYVGSNVSIETFISALCNPNSVLYTVNYAGKLTEPKAVTCYGMVCSKFTAFTLGITETYNTRHFGEIAGMELIAKSGEYDEKSLKLCDVLLLPEVHVALVTDILTDDEGKICCIEVSEETSGPCMRRKAWSVPEFFGKFGRYDLWRYSGLDSVPYTESRFVNVWDENKPLDDRKYDILSRYGDKANIPLSDKTAILDILTPGRTTCTVSVDGKGKYVFDIAGKNTVEVPLDTVGKYEVTLSDETGKTGRPTFFEVYTTDLKVISADDEKREIVLEYSSSAAPAEWIRIGSVADSYFIKADKSGRMTAKYDPDRIRKRCVCAGFIGDYGEVVSETIGF